MKPTNELIEICDDHAVFRIVVPLKNLRLLRDLGYQYDDNMVVSFDARAHSSARIDEAQWDELELAGVGVPVTKHRRHAIDGKRIDELLTALESIDVMKEQSGELKRIIRELSRGEMTEEQERRKQTALGRIVDDLLSSAKSP